MVFKNFRDSGSTLGIVLLRKLLSLLTLIFFLILAISAYLQVIFNGGPLTDWALIIHVTVAPFFAVSLMLTVLTWVHKQRFNRQDWLTLRQIIRQKKYSVLQENHLHLWNKLYFWIFTLAAIPAIVSIIFQLYPIFNSEGMEYLLQIHRYSTLIIFVALIIHWRLLMQRVNNNKN